MRSVLARCLVGATVGALPGIVGITLGNPRTGVAIAVLGAFTGTLLAIPGVSRDRVFTLLCRILITHNIPGKGHIYDLSGSDSQDPQKDPTRFDPIGNWVFDKRSAYQGGKIVVAGLLTGLTISAIITVSDHLAIAADKPSLVLPIFETTNALVFQSAVFIVASTIWTGTIFGIVAAPGYRRLLLTGIATCTFFGGLVGYAGSPGNSNFPISFAIFLSTITAPLSMLLASLASRDASVHDRADGL